MSPSRGIGVFLAVVIPLFGACSSHDTSSGSGGTPGSGGSGSGATTATSGTVSTGSTGATTTSATSTTSGTSSTGSATSSTGTGAPTFSPYKDTSINMDWNTNVISTKVSGASASLASDLSQNGGKTITLAFATGECGSENWGGVGGAAIAMANVSAISGAGVRYIISTGGAGGTFTCATDSGMETFIGRWSSPNLIGVDFDIEGGQSQSIIDDLIKRIQAAHGNHPALRFSLTLATLADNAGASMAQSLGASAPDSFNSYGDMAMGSIKSKLGFTGSPSSWPSYLTINLMTMDYGAASSSVCVVSNGACQMGQSALQAAYNLHDKWGVPYESIELTPMIGGNDAQSEHFTLADASTLASFALSQKLAGVHYWSYDRDVDCPPGPASPTCNSLGTAGTYGFLKHFMSAGL